MIFNEIYSSYYNAVSEILKQAVEGSLTQRQIYDIVAEKAFAESGLAIVPSLREHRWQLLNDDLSTPIMHIPTMPLTVLQKRWLKSISLDPRFQLFADAPNTEFLKDVEPLFTPDDHCAFDRYVDSDPYTDPEYIEVFRALLRAIREKRRVKLIFTSRRSNECSLVCIPHSIEYSSKDDKFRLIIYDKNTSKMMRISKIKKCLLLERHGLSLKKQYKLNDSYLVMELENQRNALERVMMHFAHFEKTAERIDKIHYRLKIYYSAQDVSELVIRVLSFGPLVKITEPPEFVELIKERLVEQLDCDLK